MCDINKKLKIYRNKNFTDNMMSIKNYISRITLSVNGLKAPIKRHRVADCIINNRTRPYAVYKRHIWNLKIHPD